ncbi:MAG: hypothetical protein IPN51_08835 [Chloracidobacterium sp.]|nr:hypothetical protein [Chloracidobacterium sp.]
MTVAASVSADQLTVDAGGQITISSGNTFTLANGTGTDLTLNGTLVNSGTLNGSGAWTVGPTGTFVQNTTTGISTPLNNETLDAASNFIYRGSSTLNPGPSISSRTYGNLSFESTSGAWSPTSGSGGNPLLINGVFSVGTSGGGTVSYNTTGFTGSITANGGLNVGSGSSQRSGQVRQSSAARRRFRGRFLPVLQLRGTEH